MKNPPGMFWLVAEVERRKSRCRRRRGGGVGRGLIAPPQTNKGLGERLNLPEWPPTFQSILEAKNNACST